MYVKGEDQDHRSRDYSEEERSEGQEGGKKGVNLVILELLRKLERTHFRCLWYICVEMKDHLIASPGSTRNRRG